LNEACDIDVVHLGMCTRECGSET